MVLIMYRISLYFWMFTVWLQVNKLLILNRIVATFTLQHHVFADRAIETRPLNLQTTYWMPYHSSVRDPFSKTIFTFPNLDIPHGPRRSTTTLHPTYPKGYNVQDAVFAARAGA